MPERSTKDFRRDFGPWVTFVSYGSDTYRHDRHGGRDKSARRPYETDPIHPLT